MREIALDTAFGRLSGLRWPGPAGAPRVLALHGWLDNAASFIPLQARLPGIELAALDLPGHGASAHLPPAAEYTVPNAARAVFAAADALGWDRFVLLGHSLGGAIASLMAAAMPARVERLAVIETLGALGEDEADSARRLQEAFAAGAAPRRPLRRFRDPALALKARLAAGGIEEAAARLLVERGIAPVRGADGPPGYAWRSDPRLTRPTAVRMSEGQVHAMLAAIECPVRVVYANPPQPYFPEAQRQARYACLRDASLVTLEGGHHLHMEQPEAVAAALQAFLRPA
ncbi:alpha/beta hydrolase [Lysobacter sp. GX 14042]|uniref:alpha/beta fold hydrolase n=1 Tax=Lysobacter sp. GX 14042 TaxID=2907155 RepID=UPI001F380B3C|nr:alpha/beta hydrolase [Lysobacter sp. GX 14042]MCE7032412.1 alpha/beta hydrolase [Lysobacter sp. GX 14042]